MRAPRSPRSGPASGSPRPAVKRRVDRLVADGSIRGFHALLDDEATGATTEAFVELHCRSRTNPTDIAAMVADQPDIVAVYTVTGDADALLHVKTASPSTLEAVVEQRTRPPKRRAHENDNRPLPRRTLTTDGGVLTGYVGVGTRPWRCKVWDVACSRVTRASSMNPWPVAAVSSTAMFAS